MILNLKSGCLASGRVTRSGGELVLCTGKLENRTWNGRDGEPRSSTSLKCDFVTVASSGRRTDAEGDGTAARPAGRGVDVYPEAGEFAEIGGEDGELPF